MNVRAERKGSVALELITASVIAVLISLILLLFSAFLAKSLNLSDGWLMPIDQFIKAVSLFAGAMIAFKDKRNGWLKGLVLGLIYIALAFVIFSLASDTGFTFDLSLLWDSLLGAGMGLICGVLVVNIKK
ncbi:MAG: TIGR04086 family membrane protein [Clostridiales bacterium]|nr:TIGR04086 family membrane protein [Clostridiales bacterium]